MRPVEVSIRRIPVRSRTSRRRLSASQTGTSHGTGSLENTRVQRPVASSNVAMPSPRPLAM